MKKITSMVVAVLLCMGLSVTAFAKGMNNFEAAKEYTGFSDVAEAAWYHGSVKAAFEYGLIKGASPTEFKPDGTLTVAEAIVMADRIHMLYETGEDTLVNGTPWYQTYVDYAIENDIIEDGDFVDYNRNITRGEMADIFTRALPEEEYEVINDIPEELPIDIVGHEYEDSIRTLFRAGIVTGNDPYGTYTPDASIKRCEAAAIISRIVDKNLRKRIELLVDVRMHENIIVPVIWSSEYEYIVSVDAEDETKIVRERLSIGHEHGMSITDLDYCIIEECEGAETILDVPIDYMAEVIGDGAEVKSDIVYFGDVPAYRYEYEDWGGANYDYQLYCVYYIMIYEGNTYSTACFVGLFGDPEVDEVSVQVIEDIVNNFKFFDKTASLKFVSRYN